MERGDEPDDGGRREEEQRDERATERDDQDRIPKDGNQWSAYPQTDPAGKGIEDKAAAAAFREDLCDARYLGLTRFPALTLCRTDGGTDGEKRTLLLVGYRPYDALLRALAHLAPELEPERQAPCPGAYAAFWGGATEREIAEALDHGGTRCPHTPAH